jgi:hypothetical protein
VKIFCVRLFRAERGTTAHNKKESTAALWLRKIGVLKGRILRDEQLYTRQIIDIYRRSGQAHI